ncbi:hypothetical protein B1R32_10278 [Abditibacterium utsteinense]|uniref:Tetratricopeptide repeat-containing protein n=1 Tax=Abditibacterium utsteinense TaxID=1960156 RepID=A0A2S8SW92_9BACT|nr:zinc ribbon domain-containing protein [Abditibacterium utsteinense]PQV65071.1 hypothetical protein B1R32_10278 [Abditibacterium utsteinense]
MNGFSFVLLILAGFFAWRGFHSYINASEAKRFRREERERTRHVLELDPSNSGTRAQFAAFLMEDGEVDAAIHEYRNAISTSPYGPFTDAWKRKLKEALEIQAILARGERVPGFNEWRVCPKCQAKVSIQEKTCPTCGEVLHMNTLEWVLRSDVQRDIWSHSIPIALVLWIVAIIFSTLPREVQGTLIISSILVGYWLFLRSFNV